jgi:hypothetical protein
MHENKYNHYRIPAGLLIVFLEKALTLIHMETHLNDVNHNTHIQYIHEPNLYHRMKKLSSVHYHLHCSILIIATIVWHLRSGRSLSWNNCLKWISSSILVHKVSHLMPIIISNYIELDV